MMIDLVWLILITGLSFAEERGDEFCAVKSQGDVSGVLRLPDDMAYK